VTSLEGRHLASRRRRPIDLIHGEKPSPIVNETVSINMALTLAFLDVGSLFAALSLLILLWAQPLLTGGALLSSAVGEALTISLCFAISFYYNDLYNLRVVRSFEDFASRLLESLGVAFLLLAACYSLHPRRRMSDEVFVSLLMILAGLIIPLRALCYRVMRRTPFSRRVLILGTGPLAAKIADEIQSAPCLGFSIAGFVADDDTVEAPALARRPAPPYPRMSRMDFLEESIDDLRPDHIVVALRERRGRLPVKALLTACNAGTSVEDGIEFYERLTEKLAIENLTPSGIIFSHGLRRRRSYLVLSRAISVAVAFVGLVLTAPLLAVVAALVKLESRGPVLFLQDRVGRCGRVFRLIKFRTMDPTKPAVSDSVFRRDDDGRISLLGRWLRRLRLDELPQFINILRGDMNLVGPRPEMAGNVQVMTELIPYYSLRHAVRPGVTGWAQVKQGYAVSLEEVVEKTRYDLYYIRHMSLGFDLRILVDTVKIVLFGRGAK
jgi:exopolysaccharide biosynthesis polyprenyl glycosylphosphotransferase